MSCDIFVAACSRRWSRAPAAEGLKLNFKNLGKDAISENAIVKQNHSIILTIPKYEVI